MQSTELREMVDGYIEAIFFTADEELIAPKSGEFDVTPHLSRVPASMLVKATRICREFLTANLVDLADYPARNAGHDLWYTQNGHGCGFWEADHCTDEEGCRLTDNAKRIREMNLYRGAGGWWNIE